MFLLKTIVLHSNLSLLGFLNIQATVENTFLKVQTKALDATSEWVGVTSPTSVPECKAVQNHYQFCFCITEVKPFPKFKQIKFGHYFGGFAHFYNLCRSVID